VNTLVFVLLGVTLAFALLDWWAVESRKVTAERIAKPATLVTVIALAHAIEPASEHVRGLIVVGLVCGLVGDVLLMLDKFVPGALAFLVGHVFYIVALTGAGFNGMIAAITAVCCVPFVFLVGSRIARGAARKKSVLGPIVIAYQCVIVAMFSLSVGSQAPLMAVGAGLFVVSDSLLGWNRFVAPLPHGRLATHITYHVAQTLIALSLVSLGA
jgi:alkenylglycerophosphocholine hydrolase